MCFALANGGGPEPPTSAWRKLLRSLDFGLLLARLLVVGLAQWLIQRWILRHPNVG